MPEWPAGRADARRTRAALVDATIGTLSACPNATLGEIADAAGVSRGTVYGHFANRRSLIAAAFTRMQQELNEQFAAIDSTIPASKSLDDLVATSWWVLGHFASLAIAAKTEMSSIELNRLGDMPVSHIREILLRGRGEGAFRSDQDLRWQIDCIYALLQVGTKRIREGGLTQDKVIAELIKTIRSLLQEGGAKFEERP